MQWSVGNNQFLVAFIFLFIGLATAWDHPPLQCMNPSMLISSTFLNIFIRF